MPSIPIHEAKNKLSALRREAIAGREFLLADTKRKDDQPASLISTALLDELCESKTFSFGWPDEPGKESDNYSLYNHETGVYGIGPTKKEAVEDFIDNIVDYTNVYFNDLPFYLSISGGRRGHYWYLRRILRCEGNKERIYQLMELDKVMVD
ncbi:Antitoxin of toxin-antitoxin, RelE / RelB, TA system [Desulfotomaculum arcticum]|uniref:Antitoxin of toxin-antitoxin, RelE / RelB, TA system n=1 Tax=Desulfotruncus arcticus DSM 17038 TaxID=1121424 RepID=A0A1I2Y979_9FIRM|nr:hypothetical protein [Desulfotruncus arcticus]SFH22223.1 Antitoxin of toxin-antitoxin, RelE / RelB, TA system [Desulfotomaculum arcticum] [Desulfotruncus arcticus DSM 17038]